ncbi:SCO0930 family lipoprotein [Streptomyces sp. NPDC047108]|uniref:SCO0930 family lipoprotein n=1 Tax=Streptomyces sp. NPDC047108 TaxID=3155025 RepID=UPI0033C697E5
MRKWQSASIAVAAVAVMLTAGCGSQQAQSQSQPAAAQPAGQADAAYGGQDKANGGGYGGADPQGKKAQGKPAGQLMIGDDKKLGSVLTDSEGFTLYRFEKDTAKPPKTNCEGDCAKAWPPVPADDVSSAAGIDPSLLGEVKRADGTQQLTVDGWPMYRYAKDTKPWQIKGEGVGGTWYAASPEGKKASADGADEGGGGEVGAGGGERAALSAFKDEKLGKILRDGKGRTLYRFNKDSAWPMKSNCTGSCLDTWKPAKPVSKDDVEGVNPKLLSKFTRPDGDEQLAIDCWLLYWYTGDEKPGDTNGQGVGGAWFAVSPDGKKVGAEK